MIKRVFYLFSLLIAMGLVSCSSDNDRKEVEIHDFNAFTGEYIGVMEHQVESSNESIKNIKIAVNALEGKNVLILTLDNFTTAKNGTQEDNNLFRKIRISAQAYVVNGKCEFRVSDFNTDDILNLQLKGVIEDKAITFEGSGVGKDGSKVDLKYHGSTDATFVYDLEPFVGELVGETILTIGEDSSSLKEVKAKIATTKVDNELSITFSNLIIADNDVTEHQILVEASVRNNICVIDESVIQIKGLKSATIKGAISNNEDFELNIIGTNNKGEAVKARFVPASDVPIEEYDLDAFIGEYGADAIYKVSGNTYPQKNLLAVVTKTNNINELKVIFVDVLKFGKKENLEFVSTVIVEDNICKFVSKSLTRALEQQYLDGTIDSSQKVLKVNAYGINALNQEFSIEFEGGVYAPTPTPGTDYSAYVGIYGGKLEVIESEFTREYNRIKSEVKTADIAEKLDINLFDIPLAGKSINLSFVTTAVVGANDICKVLSSTLDVEGYKNLVLEGEISSGKIISLKITGEDNNGNLVSINYSGTTYKEEKAFDLTSFVGDYIGTATLKNNETAEVKSTLSTTATINELKVSFTNYSDLSATDFIVHVDVKDGVATFEPSYPIISGFENLTLVGTVTSDKMLNISFTSKNGAFSYVAEEDVPPVPETKVVEVGYYSFDDSFEKVGKFIIPTAKDFFEWSSSDYGLKSLSPKRYSVSQEEGYKGKAVAVQTFATKHIASGFAAMFAPRVTAGSLFIGDFQLSMAKPLTSTKFGVVFDKKVTKVKGFYKYIPGKDYHKNTDTPTEGNDEFSIAAVLYEVSSDNESLDGTNINDDSRIVGYKILVGGEQKEFKEFELELDYTKEFDENKKYKFAIVCSSSKDGNIYHGAHESKLWIDEIKVFAEVTE